MAERDPQSGDGLTEDDLLESMMTDSIGLDNPMTPQALAIAGAEVTLRIETAKKVLSGKIGQITDIDSKAMTALFLM